MALQIVLVERDTLSRTGLERLLSAMRGIAVSGSAGSIAAAERLAVAPAVDIVLAAADLPDMSGTAGIGRLHTRFPSARIVILGPAMVPGMVIAAFRAGADGYLTRDTSVEGLVRALRGIEQGEVPLPRSLVRVLVDALRFSSPLLADETLVERLSRRERQVLEEVSCGRSNAEIAARLGVSESTVKTHVSNILRKTGSRSRFILQASG